MRSVPRHILSTAHHLVVPGAPLVTAQFDWRFYPPGFSCCFFSIAVCQRGKRISDRADINGRGVRYVKAGLALFRYMITILINLAFCITSEPVKCVGKYLLPIE